MFTELARQADLPLSDLLLPLSSFRFRGSPDGTEIELGVVQSDATAEVHRNTKAGLELRSEVQMGPDYAVIRRTLMNPGDSPSAPLSVVEPLRLVFAHPPEAWRHIYAAGGTSEHAYPPEAYTTRESSRNTHGFEIRCHPEGRSSNLHLPLLVSLTGLSPADPGLFCAMEWSADWYLRWQPTDEGSSEMCAGIPVNGMILAPGESITLPPVHLGFFSGGGPDGATNRLRRYLYDNVCARYNSAAVLPPVSYDHWFGIGNNLTEELLIRQADRAAEIGVEVFVVDASWFPGDFPLGVGNWNATDTVKFPRGLEPLAQYVRDKGMEFGLWVEPERASEGTWAVETHPELFVPVGERYGRLQYHINLGLVEAQDFLIETIGALIRRLDLHWSRWDYNIDPLPLWNAVDPTKKIQFDYMRGLYRVLDTLMDEHPRWFVEQCSSGGRRIDLGTMRRAHTYWFSDQSTDPWLCRYMQARANRFLPGHLLNSSVAVAMDSADGELEDAAVLSRMLGKLAFDGDIARWSPQAAAQAAMWADEFKRIRPLLVRDFYQLLPAPQGLSDWDACQFVDYDGTAAALFVFAGAGGGRTIRLKGLRLEDTYTLQGRPAGEAVQASGADLMEEGVAISLGDGEACLWLLSAEEE